MKKNLLIFSFIAAGFLILPAFCFGAIEYSRNPSGYTIQNPVNINVSLDNFEEDTTCSITGLGYWGVVFVTNVEEEINVAILPFVASTTLSISGQINLPLEEYKAILIGEASYAVHTLQEFIDEGGFWCDFLEYDEDEIIFEVVAGEENGGLFTLPENALASTTANISDIIHDVGIFLWLAIGVPLGFYVIKQWLAFMPK